MSFRFFRRIRIAPGVTLNLSKSGASVSVGPRGAKFTVGPRGTRATLGLPGTGLSYSVSNPHRKLARPSEHRAGASSGAAGSRASSIQAGQSATSHGSPSSTHAAPSTRRPKLGFLKRLVTPAEDRAWVDGLAALHDGNLQTAEQYLLRAEEQGGSADARWTLGILRMRQERVAEAQKLLTQALRAGVALGERFRRYEVSLAVSMPVTTGVVARLHPDVRSTRLALAELAQVQGDTAAALKWLDRLLDDSPDAVMLAAYGDLVIDGQHASAYPRLVSLTQGLENLTPIHTAVLLYRATALRLQGLPNAALEVLTASLRRTAGRSPELLRELRYQRALCYEALGRRAQARRDLELIYAEDPQHEDVAQRLGLD